MLDYICGDYRQIPSTCQRQRYTAENPLRRNLNAVSLLSFSPLQASLMTFMPSAT